MIRKFNQRVIGFLLPLALFLGWSGVAHSQYYTVHPTSSRVQLAFEDCDEECRIRNRTLNNPRFIRMLCEMDDNEPIPNGFTLATFIACEEYPSVMVSVWDRQNEEHVCGSLDFSTISAAHQSTGPDRGKVELLLGAEGPPLLVTAFGKYGPLPQRFEMEESCWLSFRTRSIAGALEEDLVVTEGVIRGNAPFAVYGDE